MRYLSGNEAIDARAFIDQAVRMAEHALCRKAKCGTVIVNHRRIIGEGYNAPPQNDIAIRKCDETYSLPPNNKYDRTCCVHAEQRAIRDALRKNPEALPGARLYFARLGADGKIEPAEDPYCTICSKDALDTGISEFVLLQKQGICLYDTLEYNDISFRTVKND